MVTHLVRRIISVTLLVLLLGYWWYFTLTVPSNTFTNWMPHIPPSYDADMSYVYNSILPFAGYSYAHVYHPGTAMHIVGTLVGALAYPIAAAQGVSLAEWHATNPFPLLFMLRLLVGTTATLTSVLIARRTAPEDSVTGMLLGGTVGITFYAIYAESFVSLVSWSHASMGYAFGALLLLILYRLAVTNVPLTAWRRWLIGGMCGALTATAYYYAPWVLGALITLAGLMWLRGKGFLRSVLGGIEVGIASLLGFLLANLPILHKFDQFIGNVMLLSSSQGIHGSGDPGFTSIPALKHGASIIMRQFPVLFGTLGVVILIAALVAIQQRNQLRQHAALWILLLGCTFHVIFALFLVFKHPGSSYLNTVAPVVPFMLAALFKMMDTANLRRLAIGIAAIVLLLFVRQYINAVGLHWQTIETATRRMKAIDTFVSDYARTYSQEKEDVLIITSYGTHFGCYGMWFGSGYTRHLLHDYVAQACPSLIEFEGGFDGARALENEWLTLDDPRLCWDMAILEQYPGGGLLGQYSEPITLTDGVIVVTNNSLFQPTDTFQLDFDQRFCGDGWHAPQIAPEDGTTYMWMSDTTSTIDNLKLSPGSDYTLTVRVFASIAPEVLATFEPYINGQAIVLVPGENAGEFTGIITAEQVAANENVTLLDFRIDQTISPGAENGDPRQLGVAVDWITIEP